MRLLVADHPFVDGNKRTALDTTATFYMLTGIRSITATRLERC
nr:Fic family protein [Halogranum rubrum]